MNAFVLADVRARSNEYSELSMFRSRTSRFIGIAAQTQMIGVETVV